MAREADFIAALRTIATHPAARGLADDAAVLDGLVYTHDMIAEGVHYLASDPPADVAWKLLAVNLSDLAAKGAAPIAVLMAYALTGDADWDAGFVAGLKAALAHFNVALIGGDTVKLPPSAPRVLALTAIGKAGARVPSRSGAQVGDAVYVTGVIGDAGLGLRAGLGLAAASDFNTVHTPNQNRHSRESGNLSLNAGDAGGEMDSRFRGNDEKGALASPLQA